VSASYSLLRTVGVRKLLAVEQSYSLLRTVGVRKLLAIEQSYSRLRTVGVRKVHKPDSYTMHEPDNYTCTNLTITHAQHTKMKATRG
jgi:hypothetical protein